MEAKRKDELKRLREQMHKSRADINQATDTQGRVLVLLDHLRREPV